VNNELYGGLYSQMISGESFEVALVLMVEWLKYLLPRTSIDVLENSRSWMILVL